MALTIQDNGAKNADQTDDKLTFQANGADRIDLPSADFIADAQMTREGDDLVLETPGGEVAVIEGYFAADPAPVLHSPDGAVLTPNLVQAFAHSPMEFAANETASDQSPVGAVEEVKGNATVTRADGTVETITNGTPIYQGDVVETDAAGAVNIVFIDETSMAISSNARLAIDQYTYDPSTESGTTNFSVLRGLFVFTSGLIGRDDPDDVKIDTPVGSIGIRGTIIAGEIIPGGESNISVLEGAIVIKNGNGEITLSEQFETVRLSSFDQPMKDMGVLPASDINSRFSSISDVNASLFTMINDAVKEQSVTPAAPEAPKMDAAPEPTSSNEQTAPQPVTAPAPDALAPIDSSVASLNTSTSSGLPSSGTIAGEPATGLAGSTVISPSAATSFDTGTTTPVTTSPTIAAAGTTTTTAAPTVADTVQPPPSVTGSGTSTGTGTTSGGGTVTPSTPAWAAINLAVADSSSHHLIGDNGINNMFGYSISALGDINNDGFDDFVVGKDSGDPGQNHSYVFNGALGGIVDPDAAGNTVANGTDPSNFSNSIVAGVGDFNGNGTRDFVVGQSFNGTGSQGQVRLELWNGTFINGPLLNGSVGGNEYGASVSGMGDFNNDGYADIVVGSPGSSGGLGEAFLVKGAISAPTPSLLGIGVSNDAYGADVAGIGDFNGDGYSDLIVGAPGGNYAQIHFGFITGGTATSLVLTGADAAFGEEVQGLGDINGDGYSDILVGGSNSGSIFFGGAAPNVARDISFNIPGGYTINGGGAAGDFNGDGYKDFTLSLESSGGTETYIVFGKSAFGGNIDYNYLQNYNNAIRISYPSTVNATGDLEIASLGDVDGDGYDDIGIGVSDSDINTAGNGGMFVVYGRDTGNDTADTIATNTVRTLVGTDAADILGDGGFGNVSMRGGAGNDTFTIGRTDFLGIDGGGGTLDTIHAVGNLNFGNVNFEKISGIEKIEFGTDNQTVTLTMENLFNLLKSSDTGQLTIDRAAGISGAQLILDDGIDFDGNTVFDDVLGNNNTVAEIDAYLDTRGGGVSTPGTSGNYNTFTIGGYTLLIDNAITVDAQ